MQRLASAWKALPVVLALVALPGLAAAQFAPEADLTFAGKINVDIYAEGNGYTNYGIHTLTPTVVYDNTGSSALFGFSSTDLNSIMGDEVLTTGTGTLSEVAWSVFNSGSSAGSLLTATYLLSFYDAILGTPYGSFTVNVNFGTGLAKGYYTIVDVPNLDALGINITGTDVLVTQKRTAHTGTASRLGIVSLDPPSVGSSPAYFFLSNTTSAAGYYTIASGNANPGFLVSLAQSVTPAKPTTWGHVKSLFR